MSDISNIEVQIQALIDDAKGHKSILDMAKLDYKHVMKKLSIIAEQYPALAIKFGLTKVADGAKADKD